MENKDVERVGVWARNYVRYLLTYSTAYLIPPLNWICAELDLSQSSGFQWLLEAFLKSQKNMKAESSDTQIRNLIIFRTLLYALSTVLDVKFCVTMHDAPDLARCPFSTNIHSKWIHSCKMVHVAQLHSEWKNAPNYPALLRPSLRMARAGLCFHPMHLSFPLSHSWAFEIGHFCHFYFFFGIEKTIRVCIKKNLPVCDAFE